MSAGRIPEVDQGDHGVQVRHGWDALIEATGGHPFVRWELTEELARTWWQVGGAVGFRRLRPTGRRSFSLLGSDDGVARITATVSWTVPADEAVRILERALPRG